MWLERSVKTRDSYFQAAPKGLALQLTYIFSPVRTSSIDGAAKMNRKRMWLEMTSWKPGAVQIQQLSPVVRGLRKSCTMDKISAQDLNTFGLAQFFNMTTLPRIPTANTELCSTSAKAARGYDSAKGRNSFLFPDAIANRLSNQSHQGHRFRLRINESTPKRYVGFHTRYQYQSSFRGWCEDGIILDRRRSSFSFFPTFRSLNQLENLSTI